MPGTRSFRRRRFRPDLPRDLEAVVLRCLAKNPNDRYPDTPSLAKRSKRCIDASNWSPEHAANWWQANVTLNPSELDTHPGVPRFAKKERSPETTEELESAEMPRFT